MQVIDKRDDTGYITPKEAQGEFDVYVSRIRNDPTIENGLNLWVVADNLRKGAALNAVQIAQLLVERRACWRSNWLRASALVPLPQGLSLGSIPRAWMQSARDGCQGQALARRIVGGQPLRQAFVKLRNIRVARAVGAA